MRCPSRCTFPTGEQFARPRIRCAISEGYSRPCSSDPAAVSTDIGGIRYVRLPTLIELKLASGMTSPGRLKDLGDVQELIKALRLPKSFSDELNPYVRAKFLELWVSADDAGENG
jgi:hypothetical protein